MYANKRKNPTMLRTRLTTAIDTDFLLGMLAVDSEEGEEVGDGMFVCEGDRSDRVNVLDPVLI